MSQDKKFPIYFKVLNILAWLFMLPGAVMFQRIIFGGSKMPLWYGIAPITIALAIIAVIIYIGIKKEYWYIRGH